MSLLHTCKGHDGDVNHCQWSPVSPYIVTAGGDKVARLWDATTGKELADSPLRGHSYYVNCCVFSPNGDLLATSSSDGSIKLWSTTTWKQIGTLIGHKGSVKMCCFSPDGSLVASCGGGGDESLRIWDVNAMTCRNVFEKHDCSVNCCTFASVGWLLASGGSSGEVILSDVFSNRLLRKAFAHDMGVSWLQFASNDFNADKFLLATVGLDDSLKLWTVELASKEGIKLAITLEGHSAAVYSCHFSPDSKYIVTGSADKSVILWNVEDGRILKKIDAHSRYVTHCCFSPCGKMISSTSNDKTLKIWSLDEPELQDQASAIEVESKTTQEKRLADNNQQIKPPMEALKEVYDWLSSIGEDSYILGEKDKETVTKLSRLAGNALEKQDNSLESNGIETHLKCPITQELFQDPVVAADGHTYERSGIMSWLMEGNRRSPVTNTVLPNTTLIQNHCVKSIKVYQCGK